MSSESQTRKEIIGGRLLDAGWNTADRTQVIEEFFVSQDRGAMLRELPALYNSREFSDYVLLGKNGKPLAVVEAKKSTRDAEIGREQARQYCVNIQYEQNGELPFCFYTNGQDIFFWNLGEAPPRKVHGFPLVKISNVSSTFGNTKSRLSRSLSILPSRGVITSYRLFARLWRASPRSVANSYW